jgi:GntR family transcriptional regulator
MAAGRRTCRAHLSKRHGISIGTVRKAIDELVAENIRSGSRGAERSASHNRDRMLFYFFHVVPLEGLKEYPDVGLLAFNRGRPIAQRRRR